MIPSLGKLSDAKRIPCMRIGQRAPVGPPVTRRRLESYKFPLMIKIVTFAELSEKSAIEFPPLPNHEKEPCVVRMPASPNP